MKTCKQCGNNSKGYTELTPRKLGDITLWCEFCGAELKKVPAQKYFDECGMKSVNATMPLTY